MPNDVDRGGGDDRMSIDCPCGQDCYAGEPEASRAVAESTLHWRMAVGRAELNAELRKLGNLIQDKIVALLEPPLDWLERHLRRIE